MNYIKRTSMSQVTWCVIIVFAVLFPGIWFCDVFFASMGGRPAKMAAWGVFLFIAVALAIYSAWLRQKPKQPMISAMILSGIAAGYFFFYSIIQSPVYDYSQTISLCLLCPTALFLGMACGNKPVSMVLAMLGGSVYLLFSYVVISGNYDLSAAAWQTILPDTTREEPKNTGYQGLTLDAGLLSVFLLSRIGSRPGKTMYLLLFCMSLFPVLFIGGRSPIVALAATLVLWALINTASNRRRRRHAFWFVFIICLLTVSAIQRAATLPLGIQRFLWLFESDIDDPSKRLTLWIAAIQCWLESPQTIFLGIGPQQFPEFAGYGIKGMYPHNIILETLAEYGLVGLFLLVAAPLFLFRKTLCRQLACGTNDCAPLLFLCYQFILFMFTGSLASMWPLFFCVGWYWARTDVSRGEPALGGCVSCYAKIGDVGPERKPCASDFTGMSNGRN